MSGVARVGILALVMASAAAAICMALPAFDPSCAMPAAAAGALDACRLAQASARELALIEIGRAHV